MKRFVVLPIIALLVSSCSCSLFSKKSSDASGGDDPSESSDPFTNGPYEAGQVEKGAEHSLPWNVNYQLLKSDNGALDYGSYHKTYEFSGTNVYCYGMRAVTDISINVNGKLIAYSGFEIIHFCKVNHDTWPDGGQIQISDLKPSRAVVEVVSQAKYSYASSSAPTIYVGTKKVSAPGTAIKTVSPIHSEFNVYTITYELNATSAGVIKIKNDQTFSMYIQSIQFE